jgi:tetratricopeptide (TPR) repeat protein
VNRWVARAIAVSALALLTAAIAARLAGQRGSAGRTATITVDYPPGGAIFPPEFPPPTFLWRDPQEDSKVWTIEAAFADGSASLRLTSRGGRLRLGEIDPRCVGPTNEPPALTPEQAVARAWAPDATTWTALKTHSTNGPARITITGYRDLDLKQPVSRGYVAISTSRDRVGAPIFYRDVPLMPSEVEKGVIKPLAPQAVPLIAWRLRDVGQTSSRVVLTGIHSCANCHSFSRDGKTLGLDVDGPKNEKGLYAIVPVQPRTIIRNEDVVAWSTFRGKLGSRIRVGFMSQVSPDGLSVVTTINDPGQEQSEYQRRKNPLDLVLNYYVANFKDYRFLQVFYPTRGILAWYSKATGMLQPLPGADDPRFVQTSATWSPDGKFLVFSRAPAQDAYPPGSRLAERANDPNETQVQFDLYRVPFNNGQGGRAEPIAGAAGNGMSNSFPKVSPDGRWIVFVQARNGQLMRPDSQLYIVPAAGGEARRMRCNTPLMNSWHSFSPNGRWLVFSSKSRSPYTQMFLTHIDAAGNDSPAILIENSTAANRAVNIPEFVNIPPDGLVKIEAPATEYYRLVDSATALLDGRQYEAAVVEWTRALERNPSEAAAHYNLGVALTGAGRAEEAMAQYSRALELSPEYPEAHTNLGAALVASGKADQAIAHFEKALQLNPENPKAENNLGVALSLTGKLAEALPHLERAAADSLSGGREPTLLHLLASAYAEAGRYREAAETARRALAAAVEQNQTQLVEGLKAKLALYESRVVPFSQ